MAIDCIPSNPDIYGIRIRMAIYAQNFACFLPIITHLWDKKLSRVELQGIKEKSIRMLSVALAILLTTIILVKGAGGAQTITNYDAAIVLDLSWINDTHTWIWLILYVHCRSNCDEQRIGENWRKWHIILLEPLLELLGRNEGGGARVCIVERRQGIAQRFWHFIYKKPVLTLGSMHLSLMAAIGAK